MLSILCCALLALPPAVEDTPLWRLESHAEHVGALAWSRDGSLLASGHGDGKVIVVETAGWRARFTVELGKSVEALCFSPDGSTLAAGGGTREVAFLDTKDGSARRTTGAGDTVRALAFSPDGRELAVGSYGFVRWIDPSGGPERKLELKDANVTALAWSPDGGELFAGGWVDFRVIDPVAPAETRKVKGGHKEVYSTAVTPDGRTYAFSSADETVCLRDVAKGEDVRILDEKVRGFAWLDFSSDGATLWCGSWDKSLRAWDASTGRKLVEIAAHEARIDSIAVSPDGKAVAVGLRNGTVVVWDAAKARGDVAPK